MALVEAIGHKHLSTGRSESAGILVPLGVTRITVQIKAILWNDANVRLTLIVERSDDGGKTWWHWASGVIVGGARAQDGSLPYISFPVSSGDSFFVRVAIETNKDLTVGVDLTVE